MQPPNSQTDSPSLTTGRAFVFARTSYPGGTGVSGFFVGDGSSPVVATFVTVQFGQFTGLVQPERV